MNQVFIIIFTTLSLMVLDCLVYNWIYTGGFNLLKLELHFPNLLKETYIIHRTGGEHPFKHVSTAAPLFKEDCWPYIQRIHWPDTKMNAYKGEKNDLCLLQHLQLCS